MQAERETTDIKWNIWLNCQINGYSTYFKRCEHLPKHMQKALVPYSLDCKTEIVKKIIYRSIHIFIYRSYIYIIYIFKNTFFEWTIFILLFINLVHLKKVVFFLNIYMKMNRFPINQTLTEMYVNEITIFQKTTLLKNNKGIEHYNAFRYY